MKRENPARAKRAAPVAGAAVSEVTCRTILSPCGIPGLDFSINPYTGCTHACAYCYASYMQRYSGHHEPWGRFVDAKMNAPQVLIRQLRRTPPSSLFMSSVTDPYQPAEERYRITRRILQTLAPLPHALHVHTKSSLVERDIDILSRFREVSVSVTIVTADRRAAACIEPGASPVGERLRVLKRLSYRGIKTAVFIGPVIPLVTEKRIEDLVRRIAMAGVSRVVLDDLHYTDRVIPRLSRALARAYPRTASRLAKGSGNKYQQISRYILECCRYYGIRCSS